MNKLIVQCLENKLASFEQFCKFIQNPDVYMLTNRTLKGYFKEESPIKIKYFLCLFLIYHYPKYVLENESKIDLNEHVFYKCVKYTIEVLKTEDVVKIKSALKNFEVQFDSWKQSDKKYQLKIYSETFYELELFKLKSTNLRDVAHIYKKAIVPLQEKIKNSIKKIAGDDGLKYLENYKNTNLKLTVELEKKLRFNLKKAFWKRFQDELVETPVNTSQIILIFKDISKMLKSLTPNNMERHEDINQNIDIEYLDILVKNNTLKLEDMLVILTFIINTIKELGMPENDTEMKQYLTELEKFKQNESTFNFIEHLPKYFEIIMVSIEKIQMRIVALML
jgi:hypothetical protein